MKGISAILFAISTLFVYVSCDNYDQFTDEQYKKVIYVLSRDNNKVYPGIHDLKDPVTTGYVTVYAGGTNPIEEDVTIEFEQDDSLFHLYNRINFDIDTVKFAQILDTARFDIQSYSVTLKAGSDQPYALLPIRVHTEGLSPDSTYFIPLKIKSISNYEVNPEYSAVLYQVYLENAFAQQKEQTSYSLRGEKQEEGGVLAKITSNSKRAYPISSDQIRIFADLKNSSDKENEINQFSILLQIKEDSTIAITSYKPDLMEVEQLDINEGDNEYRPDVLGTYRLYIHYRYRTRSSVDGTHGKWTTTNANLRRLQ